MADDVCFILTEEPLKVYTAIKQYSKIKTMIIGGGVAGLALTRGLWEKGCSVTMYER